MKKIFIFNINKAKITKYALGLTGIGSSLTVFKYKNQRQIMTPLSKKVTTLVTIFISVIFITIFSHTPSYAAAVGEDYIGLSISEVSPGTIKLDYTVVDSTGVTSFTIQKTTGSPAGIRFMIPTLSEYGYILLILALLAYGFYRLPQTKTKNRFAAFIMFSSVTFFSAAYAVVAVTWTDVATITNISSGTYYDSGLSEDTYYYRLEVVVDSSTLAPYAGINAPTLTTTLNTYAVVAEVTAPPTTPATHTITASAGTNGSISPSGTLTLDEGASQTFVVTPSSSCYRASVCARTGNLGKTLFCTFENITADQTLAASFELDTYDVWSFAVGLGSILPSGNTLVDCGVAQTFTITPITGYQVADVKISNDGGTTWVSVGAVTTYTFTTATDSTKLWSITATFELTPSTPTCTNAADDPIELISLATGGTQCNGESTVASTGYCGETAVFESWSSNCTASDTNNTADVFVSDIQNSTTSRVSVASDSTEGDGRSGGPSINSDDGRYVAFYSSATNLVASDTNAVTDVFVHDTQNSTTTRISVASDSTEGNGSSGSGYSPSISSDGQYVAFYSNATNLVANDTNAAGDVFMRDTQNSTTTRLSVASDSTEGDGSSYSPSISGDGRYVVFGSLATNLVASDTNVAGDVFVHDTQNNTTTRVSVASDGTEGDGRSDSNNSNSPFSSDGRYVAFYSSATNLVANDTNANSDVFVHDTQNNTTTRVSVASDSTEGNGSSYNPSISSDGRYVVFYSTSTDLVANDTNARADIFVHDTENNTTTRLSVASDSTQGNGSSYSPSISGDGRYVVFESTSTNLVTSSDTNGTYDIFRAPNPLYTAP